SALERPGLIRRLPYLVVHSAPWVTRSQHHPCILGAFSPSLAIICPAPHDGGRMVCAPIAFSEGDTVGIPCSCRRPFHCQPETQRSGLRSQAGSLGTGNSLRGETPHGPVGALRRACEPADHFRVRHY